MLLFEIKTKKRKKYWYLLKAEYVMIGNRLWCLFGFWVLDGVEQVFQEPRGLVQLLHSQLFSICARQDALIRICRNNQPSPDCFHCYSGNPADFCAHSRVKFSTYLPCSLVLPVSLPLLLVALWISKLKDLALHCGFRDTCLLTTCLLTTCLFASPLTQ